MLTREDDIDVHALRVGEADLPALEVHAGRGQGGPTAACLGRRNRWVRSLVPRQEGARLRRSRRAP